MVKVKENGVCVGGGRSGGVERIGKVCLGRGGFMGKGERKPSSPPPSLTHNNGVSRGLGGMGVGSWHREGWRSLGMAKRVGRERQASRNLCGRVPGKSVVFCVVVCVVVGVFVVVVGLCKGQ